MKIEIDDRSGFCFGVVGAISKAEEYLYGAEAHKKNPPSPLPLVSLGDIVHNGAEMARLEALGLEIASENSDLTALAGRRVLIRAHGEPPETYFRARENDITLIDATCPVVAKLQETVAAAYAKMRGTGGQVVIFGKRGHAEVRGLAGQARGEVTVIETEADLDTLDFTRPIYFLAQTTGSLTEFGRLGELIKQRSADPARVTIHDTICRQVSGREEHLAAFARRFDVAVFVSGAKSSNGRVLFEAVRGANPRSHKIESASELHPEWFAGAASAGICGATSTPRWLMTGIAEAIEAVAKANE